MNYTVKIPSQIILTFIWIGFICAISFMEAWLKFRAPGITVPLGLGIGKLVFEALNKVEWVLVISICISTLVGGLDLKQITKQYYLFLLPVLALILQTAWILPQLTIRSEKIIQNLPVEHSNLHFYFVGLELLKVTCLFIWGLKLFRKIH
ncbi:hypothetical protein [uncultured Cytophaga sp.]|uniref:hypothetical protein n=1 Tax=uncultured Cytophaga sp. TaxID=160238 RepID=UPI002626DDE2|nr:hypothetical protein [uncultured Cytophaga sp.]